MHDSKIIKLFKTNNLDATKITIDKMLQSSGLGMNIQIMDNKEFRCRLTDSESKTSYIVSDTNCSFIKILPF